QGRPRYGHDVTAAAAVAGSQEPGAVAVGCMDSRVPLEAIFDQTFGAICVARSAGQVPAQPVFGPIGFAVWQLRVPIVGVVRLEAIFDQTFGAICVARSAGHVLDQAVVGSIEFAVWQLRVPLVVVLGHERCGAVAATIDALRAGQRPGGALNYLIDEIAPAV